ncbi:hypothetical protein H9W90_07375 [Polaribacter pectinis]|uniref:Uncharacterized protein n=1 Tax=Polaribacter pectinis TaxID=2738844 RepID=A0A7G9LE72_9FLAO|nr:hypothetical protein [Polaribacter pectinis]QNM86921.1 hypothetical protein H9W90_07375 [Polaribacter pectinis]
MVLVYVFLVLAGIILLFISLKGKNKSYSNLVNFLLTTVATLIGVIMAINVSVDNEMEKEKEDLVKILESGVYVIEKVSKYVESTDSKTTDYKQIASNLTKAKNTKERDSLKSLMSYQKKNIKPNNQDHFFDSIKKGIDSLKIVFKKNIIKPLDTENENNLGAVILGDMKLPFPDYIGALLNNPDFLKGLSKKSLLTLNEDYINLQRTYEFTKESNGETLFYMMALNKIKSTLQIETAFQEERITEKQLYENFYLAEKIQSSEYIYKYSQNKSKPKNNSLPMKE